MRRPREGGGHLRASRPAPAAQTERCCRRLPRNGWLCAPLRSGMGPRLRGGDEEGGAAPAFARAGEGGRARGSRAGGRAGCHRKPMCESGSLQAGGESPSVLPASSKRCPSASCMSFPPSCFVPLRSVHPAAGSPLRRDPDSRVSRARGRLSAPARFARLIARAREPNAGHTSPVGRIRGFFAPTPARKGRRLRMPLPPNIVNGKRESSHYSNFS